MRVPEDQLVIQRLNDIIHRKGTELLFHLGMRHNLREIPKFFLHMLRIILINRLQHLVGFFDEIFADGFVGLLAVPRTAFRTAENANDLMEPGKRSRLSLLSSLRGT